MFWPILRLLENYDDGDDGDPFERHTCLFEAEKMEFHCAGESLSQWSPQEWINQPTAAQRPNV